MNIYARSVIALAADALAATAFVIEQAAGHVESASLNLAKWSRR